MIPRRAIVVSMIVPVFARNYIIVSFRHFCSFSGMKIKVNFATIRGGESKDQERKRLVEEHAKILQGEMGLVGEPRNVRFS